MKLEIETKFNKGDVIWTLHEGKLRQFKITNIQTSTKTEETVFFKLEYFKNTEYEKLFSYKKEYRNPGLEESSQYRIIFNRIQIVYSLYPENHFGTNEIHLSEETDFTCSTKKELIEKT
jgi:hypothetical protein